MSKEPTSINRNAKSATPSKGVLAWRKNTSPALEVRWSDIDSGVLQMAVDAVAQAGGAIILGCTRDGGAYSIVVLTDQEKAKEYPHSIEDCEALLTALTSAFSDD